MNVRLSKLLHQKQAVSPKPYYHDIIGCLPPHDQSKEITESHDKNSALEPSIYMPSADTQCGVNVAY